MSQLRLTTSNNLPLSNTVIASHATADGQPPGGATAPGDYTAQTGTR